LYDLSQSLSLNGRVSLERPARYTRAYSPMLKGPGSQNVDSLVAANYGCLRQMRIASIDLAQFFFMLLGRARMRANE
jgi:hypothetical protein